MNSEIVEQISKEEIEWVRSKANGIQKASRRILKEVFELGQWFLEAQERMGEKRRKRGQGKWQLWLSATFPEMALKTIGKYMQIAEAREFLEEQFNLDENTSLERRIPPTITNALSFIAARNRASKQSDATELAPAEFEEPLFILRKELKDYVYEQWKLEYRRVQIQVRMKDAKLGRKQIRQAVEWACQEHLEVKEIVLKAFLR